MMSDISVRFALIGGHCHFVDAVRVTITCIAACTVLIFP